jgi:hypothetical protein
MTDHQAEQTRETNEETSRHMRPNGSTGGPNACQLHDDDGDGGDNTYADHAMRSTAGWQTYKPGECI